MDRTVPRSAAGGLLSALALGTLVVLGACARQSAPPGGPDDRRPPVVVRTYPEPLAILDDLDAAVRFEFDERISERSTGGSLDDAVTVSPRSGEVRVSHGRRSLTVELGGGFRPGLVYRVTVRAAVSDLFGNRLADPFELVFSTGGEPVPTTLAGEVWDRVTGRPFVDALVYAVGPDGLVHESSTDERGIFGFRYLPAGPLAVTAFEDQNRDGEVDSTEVQGGIPVDLAPGDTLLVEFPVLTPDTSAARVTAAEPLDSVTVVVTFDDHLDPAASLDAVDVTLSGDGVEAPDVTQVLHEGAYGAYVESVSDSLARLDSIDAADAARDLLVADSLAALADSAIGGDSTTAINPDDTTGVAPPDSTGGAGPADTVVLNPELIDPDETREPAGRRPPPALTPLTGSRPGPTADGRRVLPGRRIVVILGEPLVRDVPYEVSVDGVVNLFGLPGGAGADTLLLETPPPPDTTGAVDSLDVDSTVVPDTGGVGRPGPERSAPGQAERAEPHRRQTSPEDPGPLGTGPR